MQKEAQDIEKMEKEYEMAINQDEGADKDIQEERGDLIPALRQEPGYLAMKYNEKIKKEKQKQQKTSTKHHPTTPAPTAPGQATIPDKPKPSFIRPVGRTGGVYVPPFKLRAL